MVYTNTHHIVAVQKILVKETLSLLPGIIGDSKGDNRPPIR